MNKTVRNLLAVLILGTAICGGGYYYYNLDSEWYELLNNNNTISFNIEDSDSNIISKVNDSEVYLDKLNTYSDTLRKEFDKQIKTASIIVLDEAVAKNGCLYINENGNQESNSTLYLALRNKVCEGRITFSLATELGNLASKAYTDVDASGKKALAATLNAYFDLIDDNTGIYDGDAILSRDAFIQLVYKSSNGVGVENKVADSTYIDASINSKGSITQGEAVYLMVNHFFGDKLKTYTPKSNRIGNIKNVKSVLDKEIIKSLDIGIEKTDRYREVTLKFMLEHQASNEVDSSLYNAIALAVEYGIITEEQAQNWNKPITKDESINLIVNSYTAMNDVYGYLSEVEYGEYDIHKLGIYEDEHMRIVYDEDGNVVIEMKEETKLDGEELLDDFEKGLLEDYYNALRSEGMSKEEAQKLYDKQKQALIDSHKPQEEKPSVVAPTNKPQEDATKKPVQNTGGSSSSSSNHGSTEVYFGQQVARTDSNGNKYNSAGQVLLGDGWSNISDLSEGVKYLYNEGYEISYIDSQGYYTSGKRKGQLNSAIENYYSGSSYNPDTAPKIE